MPGPYATRRRTPRPGSSSCSCNLLRTLPCQLDFAACRLLDLLREHAKDPPPTAGRRHIEGPCKPVPPPQPHLPDPVLDMLDVRLVHPFKADRLNQLHDALKSGGCLVVFTTRAP